MNVSCFPTFKPHGLSGFLPFFLKVTAVGKPILDFMLMKTITTTEAFTVSTLQQSIYLKINSRPRVVEARPDSPTHKFDATASGAAVSERELRKPKPVPLREVGKLFSRLV
ncbi:hypothetical protein ElyMa_000793500 [Elysia marginata]|uniref:Uncharacterized protein n=1 Tax=Elysia marginata TaxID=1093978 RepID=A0AAV4GVF4_9GAST|nr:hypothetical protein ElyMa_000793500 [Elysia marginata]